MFSSNVSKTGLSLADFLARGYCSSGSTWQKFYNKQIMNENDVYEKTVILVNVNLRFKQRMEDWAPV